MSSTMLPKFHHTAASQYVSFLVSLSQSGHLVDKLGALGARKSVYIDWDNSVF